MFISFFFFFFSFLFLLDISMSFYETSVFSFFMGALYASIKSPISMCFSYGHVSVYYTHEFEIYRHVLPSLEVSSPPRG